MPLPEGRAHDGPEAPEAPAAAGSPIGSPISGERLAMLAGVAGGGALVSELAGLFLADVPPRIDLIREAIRNEDAEALVRPAHSLKGSSSTLGADGMAELCKQLEALGGARDWPQARARLALLEAEFERVKHALAEWLAAR